MSSLYPPGPKNVPADFTAPSTRYEWQVVFVLGSLLLTLFLYLVLVAGSAWVFYQLAGMPWPRRAGDGYLFVRILGLFCSGFLFLYLFKGLFKRQGQDFTGLVEITEKDQPDLFAFLRQLCTETGVPFPHRVYVSHDVNACVFFPSSLLSLIFPRRKNLLIGLGLVQALNLTELKAVLAHELGHFSQSSMQLGTYVYMANRVLADIVYGRDFLDDFLSNMKSWDDRLAIFARIFGGLLGVLRLALEGIFKGVNLLNFSLMRQMEFNADRFAVKAAGSDAVGQLLERCQYADQVWHKLESDLWAAGDHKLYSKDIFAHFETAAAVLVRRKKDPRLGARPTAIGASAFIFAEEDDHAKVPDMWATHPSNYERERHAKAVYLPAETDDRSAWTLFGNLETLREAVSRSYYENVQAPADNFTLAEAAKVQQFLAEEYAETTYDEKYAGFYDDRYLELKDLCCLPTRASFLTGRAALEEIEGIHASLAEWMAQPAKDLRVQAEGDARIYLAHQLLAREVGSLPEFEERYRFQVQAQEMHRKIVAAMDLAEEAIHYANGCKGEMSTSAFGNVLGGLQEAVSRLNEVSMVSTGLRIPPLKNMAQDQFLCEFLGLGDLMDDLRHHGDCIEGEWIDDLFGQLGEVEDKLQRLNAKSLGAILNLQESIVKGWRDQAARDPAPRAALAGKRPWH